MPFVDPAFVNPAFVNPAFVNPAFVNPDASCSPSVAGSGSALGRRTRTPDGVVPWRCTDGMRSSQRRPIRRRVRERAIIAVELAHRRNVAEVEIRLGRDLVDDLVAGTEAVDALRCRTTCAEPCGGASGAILLPRCHNGPNQPGAPMSDYTTLPAGLPVPTDDGAASHLPGTPMPDLALATSDGDSVHFRDLGPGRSVVYLYPLTGRPGVDLPDGWDEIPGARGCSTEACDFRDHFAELQAAGAERVWGLSSQDADYQAEVVGRLQLPFSMISDPSFALGDTLGLPTFSAAGHDRLYARLTLVILDGVVEHVFYPIFPPNTHGQQVLDWLRAHPVNGSPGATAHTGRQE